MFFAGPLLACLRWATPTVAARAGYAGASSRGSGSRRGRRSCRPGHEPPPHAEYFATMLHFVDQHGAPSPHCRDPIHVAPLGECLRRSDGAARTGLGAPAGHRDEFPCSTTAGSRHRATATGSWTTPSGSSALPDVPLDWSSTAEARILEAGQPFLQPVWRDAHWQVWKVVGTKPLVEGNATLVASAFDSITFVAHSPGVVDSAARALHNPLGCGRQRVRRGNSPRMDPPSSSKAGQGNARGRPPRRQRV